LATENKRESGRYHIHANRTDAVARLAQDRQIVSNHLTLVGAHGMGAKGQNRTLESSISWA